MCNVVWQGSERRGSPRLVGVKPANQQVLCAAGVHDRLLPGPLLVNSLGV